MQPTVSAPWAYTLQLPHDPRAPGVARATLRAILATHDLPELTDTAELLASEMLTNAHLHTDGPYALRLRSSAPRRVRVAVWDSNPRIPPGFGDGEPGTVMPPPGTPGTAVNGRGLHLVRACSDAWGAYLLGEAPTSHGGKLLWAECAQHE
ncbi:ATP-binding protein [Streptomyces sp. NPDC059009]|uniref:ATP-binding protein n=1 Tax=Streptomyces sp. NPDC059009 TaxID=3346694 RepID=UPI0036A54F60